MDHSVYTPFVVKEFNVKRSSNCRVSIAQFQAEVRKFRDESFEELGPDRRSSGTLKLAALAAERVSGEFWVFGTLSSRVRGEFHRATTTRRKAPFAP
ncbi:hypothetical protein K0M31_003320, partial [Melipona bicolor]